MYQPILKTTSNSKKSALSETMGLPEVKSYPTADVTKETYDYDVIQFRGLNASQSIADDELVDMVNLSSDYMPFIGTRMPRKLVEQFTGNPNGIYSNGESLAKVDGTSFIYDGIAVGTVTDGFKTMVNMNGNIAIFPDKAYYDYVDDTWGTFDAPDLDYVCEWNNRLWGVKDGDPYIYATKQGEFDDWETKDNLNTDSYFVDTGGNTDFKGITAYNNHVTVFKSDQQLEIYGSVPSNFQVIAGTKDGLLNNEALVEVDSQLFFLSYKGPMVYTGGLPTNIGANIPQNITGGTFGKDRDKLYFSSNDGTTDVLYVYDLRYGQWHKEDFTKVLRFENHLGQLYGLCSDGKLYKMGHTADSDSGEVISWSLETKNYYDQTFYKKEYHTLNILTKLDPTGYMDIKLVLDNGTEIDYGRHTSTAFEEMEIIIPINQKKCNRFKLILEGQGKMILYHLQRQFTIGGKGGGN